MTESIRTDRNPGYQKSLYDGWGLSHGRFCKEFPPLAWDQETYLYKLKAYMVESQKLDIDFETALERLQDQRTARVEDQREKQKKQEKAQARKQGSKGNSRTSDAVTAVIDRSITTGDIVAATKALKEQRPVDQRERSEEINAASASSGDSRGPLVYTIETSPTSGESFSVPPPRTFITQHRSLSNADNFPSSSQKVPNSSLVSNTATTPNLEKRAKRKRLETAPAQGANGMSLETQEREIIRESRDRSPETDSQYAKRVRRKDTRLDNDEMLDHTMTGEMSRTPLSAITDRRSGHLTSAHAVGVATSPTDLAVSNIGLIIQISAPRTRIYFNGRSFGGVGEDENYIDTIAFEMEPVGPEANQLIAKNLFGGHWRSTVRREQDGKDRSFDCATVDHHECALHAIVSALHHLTTLNLRTLKLVPAVWRMIFRLMTKVNAIKDNSPNIGVDILSQSMNLKSAMQDLELPAVGELRKQWSRFTYDKSSKEALRGSFQEAKAACLSVAAEIEHTIALFDQLQARSRKWAEQEQREMILKKKARYLEVLEMVGKEDGSSRPFIDTPEMTCIAQCMATLRQDIESMSGGLDGSMPPIAIAESPLTNMRSARPTKGDASMSRIGSLTIVPAQQSADVLESIIELLKMLKILLDAHALEVDQAVTKCRQDRRDEVKQKMEEMNEWLKDDHSD